MMRSALPNAYHLLLAVLCVSTARLPALQITEILYHPRGGVADEERLEWLEIFNDSATPVDLSGYFFNRGITFGFAEGSILDGKSYLVLSANVAAFREKHDIDNVIGNFEGRLDNSGETISLANQNGSTVVEVRYQNGGRWPAEADGAGYSLALRWPYADTAEADSWTRSTFPEGTPGRDNFPAPEEVTHEIFPSSGEAAVWQFKKGWDAVREEMAEFSSPSDAWIQREFDDSAWETGPAPIGYGEDFVATHLDDMQGNYLAFAMRKTFVVTRAELEEMAYLELSLLLDDGCIAYLNGEEIGRTGVPGEPGERLAADVPASRSREARGTPVRFIIPPAKAEPGVNLVALEVHNSTISSADAAIVPSMSYTVFVRKTPPILHPVIINEVGAGSRGEDRFVELHHESPSELDLSGYFLSRDHDDLKAHVLATPTVVRPGEFLLLPEASLPFDLTGAELQLFLTHPDGQTVVDAVTLREPPAPLETWSHARLPDGRGRFWRTRTPSPGAANLVPLEENVILNEIHYHPLVRSDELEFLEFYNRGSIAVSLDGFRLDGGYNFVFGPEAVIPGGGYVILARDPAAVREAYGLQPGQVFGPAADAPAEELQAFGVLRNSGERIRLRDPLENPVQDVRFRDGGEWDRFADAGGSSLELIDPQQESAAGQAWAASDESPRSTWTEVVIEGTYRTNIPPLPMESELHIYLLERGECLIDDVSIMQGDPPVEFIPNGDFETGTTPWRITGTHSRSHRTTEGARTGAASLRLIASGAGDNRVNRVEIDTSPAMRAGGVRVRFWARWLGGCNRLHVSGYNNAFGATVTLEVPEDAGTPGRENSVTARLRATTGEVNLGPVLSGVRHEPAVPPPGLPIRILARVSDADGVARVESLYRRDGEEEFRRAALFDDGQHGDGRQGDGLYAGEIPGGAENDRIQYYVEARDTAERVRAFPLEGAEEPLLFIVDTSFFRDETDTNDLLRYRLIMDQQNLTELSRRLLHSDELVKGTFVFEEEEIYYNVGLRYRGSPWNRPPTPRMFRVRFQKDRLFRGEAAKINLSRYGRDQHEGVAYQLLRKASIPGAKAPYSPVYEYINVDLNGRPHSNTAMQEIRPVDTVYTRFWWPHDSDGWNWKITGKLAFTDAGQRAEGSPVWTQLRYYGPSKEDYRFYYNPGIRKHDDVFEPLTELLQTLDRRNTPDSEYERRVEEILNVESSLRVYAVRAFLADWDMIGIGNGQNAYLYYAPIEGRHYFLPWDMDHTFERTGEALVPAASTFGFGRLVSFPRFRRMYARILQENLDGPWAPSYVDRWMDRVHAVTGQARVANPSPMKGFLASRRRTVEAFVRGARAVTFEVTTPNPSAAPSSSHDVEGTAPLEVARILASVNNGDLFVVEPTWTPGLPSTPPTVWKVTVGNLRRGANEARFFALDSRGDVVDSASIALYDTTGWPAPTLTGVEPDRGSENGGTVVTVRGEGFREGVRVLFGREEATAVDWRSQSEIRVITPAGEGLVDVEVRNIDGQTEILRNAFTYVPGSSFLRGDADGDGQLRAADAVAILLYLFDRALPGCLDAADVDDDGHLNITDPARLLLFLFGAGTPPPAPYPQAGPDPTPDDPWECAGL